MEIKKPICPKKVSPSNVIMVPNKNHLLCLDCDDDVVLFILKVLIKTTLHIGSNRPSGGKRTYL